MKARRFVGYDNASYSGSRRLTKSPPDVEYFRGI